MESDTGHVFAVAGAKGGVGKTTTSINLGASFAAAGHSAVTVEMDLAMANLVDFLDVDVDVTEAATMHDVLAGEADVETARYGTAAGFDILPSGTDLAGYAGTDLSRLPDVVDALRERYEVIILDTPAGLSEETLRPLQVADEGLMVSTPRVASIRNVRNTMELAERVDTDVRGLILTKSGTGASPGAERIAEFLDVELLGHVPEDDAVPHSQDAGEPVVVDAENSGAAIAYRKIARALLGERRRGERAETRGPAENGTAATTDGAELHPESGTPTDDSVLGDERREAAAERATRDGPSDAATDRRDVAVADGNFTRGGGPPSAGEDEESASADDGFAWVGDAEDGDRPGADADGEPDASAEGPPDVSDEGPSDASAESASTPSEDSPSNASAGSASTPSATDESERRQPRDREREATDERARRDPTDDGGEPDAAAAGSGGDEREESGASLGARVRSLFGL